MNSRRNPESSSYARSEPFRSILGVLMGSCMLRCLNFCIVGRGLFHEHNEVKGVIT